MSLLGSYVSRIEALIAGMTTAGGYNSTWCALPTASLANDKNFQSFPCGQAIVITEDEDPDAEFTQTYANQCIVEIMVKDDLSSVKADPQRDIRDVYYNDLEDLKKLFGQDTSLNDLGVNGFYYLGMELVNHEDKDYFTPKHMIVRFTMTYRQDRFTPSQASC